MEKRLILAITLSFLFLAMYSSFTKKFQPVANKNVSEILKEKSSPSNAIVSTNEVIKIAPEPPALNYRNKLENKELYQIDSDCLTLKFSKLGGFLVEVYDKERKTSLLFKNIGLVKEWADYEFQAVELPRGVSFEYTSLDGYTIKKIFRIESDNVLGLTISIYNATNSKLTSYNIIGGYIDPLEHKDPIGQRYYEFSALVNDVVLRKQVLSQKSNSVLDGRVHWIGLRDRYFCSIFIPQFVVNKADIEISDQTLSIVFAIPERSVGEDVYKIYLGPQEESKVKKFDQSAVQIINYGFFDGISKGLLFLLRIGHNLTKSWGWSIIFVTVLVYVILFPLSFRSMLAMKKMQALQPKMEELKAKFKDNPQKLNTEIMELYKKEKANPFSGCLPMFLQIPVFFALYQLLMRFTGLKGAPFLWIKDLSEPDKLIIFKQSIPFVGSEFNILPILMAITMFLQQKFSFKPAAASAEAAEQQKLMSILMPILFGILFYKMSSGLVLYWFTNSLLMVAFQWKISKTTD